MTRRWAAAARGGDRYTRGVRWRADLPRGAHAPSRAPLRRKIATSSSAGRREMGTVPCGRVGDGKPSFPCAAAVGPERRRLLRRETALACARPTLDRSSGGCCDGKPDLPVRSRRRNRKRRPRRRRETGLACAQRTSDRKRRPRRRRETGLAPAQPTSELETAAASATGNRTCLCGAAGGPNGGGGGRNRSCGAQSPSDGKLAKAGVTAAAATGNRTCLWRSGRRTGNGGGVGDGEPDLPARSGTAAAAATEPDLPVAQRTSSGNGGGVGDRDRSCWCAVAERRELAKAGVTASAIRKLMLLVQLLSDGKRAPSGAAASGDGEPQLVVRRPPSDGKRGHLDGGRRPPSDGNEDISTAGASRG
jgi:hypothetical protein